MQRLSIGQESTTSLMNLGRDNGNDWGVFRMQKNRHSYAVLKWNPSGQRGWKTPEKLGEIEREMLNLE